MQPDPGDPGRPEAPRTRDDTRTAALLRRLTHDVDELRLAVEEASSEASLLPRLAALAEWVGDLQGVVRDVAGVGTGDLTGTTDELHAQVAGTGHVARAVLDRLSAREVQILHLVGCGLSRKEIAARLSLSVKTVDGHQSHLRRKLELAGHSDLVRFAIREGFARA